MNMSEQAQQAATQEAAPQVEQEAQSQEAQVETAQSAEVVDNAQEVLNDPNASKAEKKAAEKLLKKFEIKVDGKSEEVSIDLNNEEEVKRHLQMSRAASKRMQEASELRKAAEEFISLLKTNPRKVLSDPNIGVDLKKIAEEYIQEEIDRAAKTPEELEKEKLQKELQELKEKYEKEEKTRKEAEFKRLQTEQEEKVQSDIESALNTGNIPKTAYTVRKMADLMIMALQNGIDLQPRDLVPILRSQMEVDIKELFSASSDDVLEALLGKDNISRIRKRNLAKVKQQVETATQVKSTGESPKTEAKDNNKKINMKDFLKM